MRLAMTGNQLEDWVCDVEEWADAEAKTTKNRSDVDVFALWHDSVGLTTRRRAFNIIMLVRILQEKQRILVAEMANHYKYLSTHPRSFRELSCLFAMNNSTCGLNEEGFKGLWIIILEKQQKKQRYEGAS